MKALVLSGGGNRGSYQCGALEYLMQYQQYDIICGISVGALNASILSMFPKGQESNAIYNLRQLWDNLDTSQVYKNWFPFGKLHAAWKSSIYDSTPLQKLINSNINAEQIISNKRQVRIGAVCLETGEYRLFTESDSNFTAAVAASSAFPGIFCPIKIDNKHWVDGGLKEMVPMKAAVQLGATEIDVIVCQPTRTTSLFNSNVSALQIAERTVDLMWDELSANDILSSSITSKNIKINIIRPTTDLTNRILSFNQKDIQKMIRIGYEDASRICNV